MDRVQTRIEVLRVWARSNDPNRVAFTENAINEYLKAEPGVLRLSLERLCDAIDREEAEKRRGEDWSMREIMFARGFVGLLIRTEAKDNTRSVVTANLFGRAADA